MQGDIERVLFDEPAIHRRLDELAAQISKNYRNSEFDCDRGLKWELDVHGGPASANSIAAQIGFSQRRELSRKSANERRSDFQTACASGCDRPRYFDRGRYSG